MTLNTTRIDINYQLETGGEAETGGGSDPRIVIARAAMAARSVVAELAAQDVSKPTPCSEWHALDVARHVIAVIDRATAGATGNPLDDLPELAAVDHADLVKTIDASRHALDAAWADGDAMSAVIDVPWGTFPGGAVLAVYAADLLVHTWDLAVAISVELNWLEADVVASLDMARVGFPDNDRQGLPFGLVVRPGPDAAPIEHLAGWVGRDVARWTSSR